MAQPRNDFSFQFKVDGPVDGNLAKAFSDILANVQASMSRISQDQARLQDQCGQLAKDNTALRAENQKLRDEVGQLKSDAHQTPPPPPPTSQRDHPVGPLVADGATSPFQLERTMTHHEGPVHSVAIQPGTGVVASASWDCTVKLSKLATGEVVRGLNSELGSQGASKMGGLYAVAFAKTAPEVLGCTSSDKSVYLFNHHSGKLLTKLTGHTDEVNDIDFHSSQQVMCTASDDMKGLVWDFQEGITLRSLGKHTKPVYGCTFLGQENQYYVATCCNDQKTRVFDMRDIQVVAMLAHHSDDVIGIDYSGSKQLLATGSDDGQICLWDTRNWRLQQTFNTKSEPGLEDNEVKRVSFSPDGNFLAAAGSTKHGALVYNLRTGQQTPIASCGGHGDCTFDVAWGQIPGTNTNMLVTASHDFTTKYWRMVNV